MIEQVTEYLQRLLKTTFTAIPYEKEKTLSYLLRSLYHFFYCSGNGTNFIVMVDKKSGELTPAAIVKHGELLRNASGYTAVFVTDKMVAYNRERLLKKDMPFIVPERQMYLPFLGVVLSESGAKLPKEFSVLGILAQQIILAYLNRNFTESLSLSQAGQMFHYSRISIIRAFDELEYFQLAARNPKTKHLTFHSSGIKLWKKALPLLHNPCRRIIGLNKIPDGLHVLPAGTSELATRTMLSEGAQMEVAAQVGCVNKLPHVARCPQSDAPILLQLWTYPPNVVGGDAIDPFSLYLTLKNNPDERVQIALDEMMKGLPW